MAYNRTCTRECANFVTALLHGMELLGFAAVQDRFYKLLDILFGQIICYNNY